MAKKLKIETKNTHFGDIIDVHDQIPKDCDAIIVGITPGLGGIEPQRLMLPHQLYVKDLKEKFAKYGDKCGIYVIPVRSKEYLSFTFGDINPQWFLTPEGEHGFVHSNLLNFLNSRPTPDIRDYQNPTPSGTFVGTFVVEGSGGGAFYRIGREVRWTKTYKPDVENDSIVAKMVGGTLPDV